jgi:hypothetical protein
MRLETKILLVLECLAKAVRDSWRFWGVGQHKSCSPLGALPPGLPAGDDRMSGEPRAHKGSSVLGQGLCQSQLACLLGRRERSDLPQVVSLGLRARTVGCQP